MNKLFTIALVLGLTGCSLFTSKVEANTNITGTVESRCTVNTDTTGYYGNPGQVPIVRIDTSLANAYKAQISYPTSFSSSPSLGDTTVWTGAVGVDQTSSSDMSGYQAASTTANGGAMRIYPLTIAGATWFSIASVATYGGGQQKPFPGGSYTAVVIAECVAQ